MLYTPEIADGGAMYYVSISASDGSNHDTAIFVPDKFHTTPGIDVILYFHGHNDSYPDLRSYVNRPNTRALRPAVSANGQYALIIPWLGKRSNGTHIVGSTAAFDIYLTAAINQVLGKASVDPDFIGPPAFLESLVLSAHSGGGVALSSTISLGSSFLDKVVSVWGFDCFYSDASKKWINWANSNANKTMFVYYTDLGNPTKGTMSNSVKIDKGTGTNVTVERSKAVHDEIPKYYFPYLLKKL
jgi:hypothetical protein